MTDDKRRQSELPPTYEEAIGDGSLVNTGVRGKAASGRAAAIYATNENLTEDGRIDVDLNSRLSRTLCRVARLPPTDGVDDKSIEKQAVGSDDLFPIRINVTIQVVGSRGDVQPFIALGVGLQRHGHRIRVATHARFRSNVLDAGLEFYSIGGSPEDLMAYMVKNPGLIPSVASLRGGDIARKRAMIADMLRGCWDSCIQPDEATGVPFVADAIIANPPSFAHIHCAEALGIPMHMVFTMPWTATTAFAHPLANIKGGHNNRGVTNHVSYLVVGSLTWSGIGDIVNAWREKLGLEAVPATEGPLLVETLKVPHTYCWSPALVPKPKDWPRYIDISGFLFRETPAYTPSKELQAFLDAGPPPVYVGFGSIVLEDTTKLSAALVEAISICGERAIVSPGWSRLQVPAGRHDFFCVEECPHEWLFKRVSAVVHHGGAGTTAIGLREARPTIIVPFFGDQPFWGEMVAMSGAGPAPIPQREVSVASLTEAIRYCQGPTAHSAAAALSEQIKHENGVQAAVTSFHANLPLERMRCRMLPDQPASWTLKIGRKKVPISRSAAESLVADVGLDPRNLNVYHANPIYISNRRWDPVTGTASSVIATGVGMADGATGLIFKPAEEFRRARRCTPEGTAGRASSSEASVAGQRIVSVSEERPADSVHEDDDDDDSAASTLHAVARRNSITHVTSSQDATEDGSARRSGYAVAGSMAAASGKSLGKFFTSYTRGTLVDLPLATAEGFRCLPRLWGQEVKEYGQVKDLRSGAVVAGKTFVGGMATGFRDVVMHPVRGGQSAGVLGVAQGLATGTGSLVSNSVGASLSLFALPASGLTKSLYTLSHRSTAKRVMEARREEGKWRVQGLSLAQRRAVVDAYHESQR
ncbi:uncharacterized protein LTR77_009394 [Saxophila tyrrhenica]|uniref:Glycosyltransferase family 28 N-terminal domain-containing protein n=1 Tax=Saxophila tyrrhenica TaxID=1690608 RepID=A0AAV9NZB1_9PEZI|nr:hypothetical protein LTR77_009394 [Saxophila tyrrhenica]